MMIQLLLGQRTNPISKINVSRTRFTCSLYPTLHLSKPEDLLKRCVIYHVNLMRSRYQR